MTVSNVLWILALLAGAYLVLMLVVYLTQSRLLYYPEMPGRAIEATPQAVGLDYEPVRLHTDDGVALDAWFVPVEGARYTVLFCHGNAGNISHRLDTLRTFHDLGLSVLIFDYRGYGQSEGRPSEHGTYRDAAAAWRYLEGRGVAASRIIVWGRSLGAAIAAHIAADRQPAALVLESAFTSVPDRGAEIYPFLPVRWLSRFRYDTLAAVRQLDAPILIVHPRDDRTVPIAHGRRLYEAAPGPKRFVALEGDHNDAVDRDRGRYLAEIRAFLDQALAVH